MIAHVDAAGTAFDSLTEFNLAMPVVSACYAHPDDSAPGQLSLYCTQTQVTCCAALAICLRTL